MIIVYHQRRFGNYFKQNTVANKQINRPLRSIIHRTLAVNKKKEEMENEEVLNQFGKMYIESVRDNSLHTLDNILNGGAKASSIKKLNEELKSLSLTTDTIKLIQRIATRMVDATLHNTLFLFEQELDGWQISNPDEEIDSIANISDGLSGELYSSNGWIKKYSRYEDCE